jgi:hypothetical protein
MSDPAFRELLDSDFQQVLLQPWKRNIEAIATIFQWCQKHKRAVNSLLNCMLPAIAYCLKMYTSADTDGNPVVELNLGRVTIITPQKPKWLLKRKKPA